MPADATTRAGMDLAAWLADWTETARTIISRRDHLILLGLSKRKRSSKAAAEPEQPTVVAPTPAPAPVPVIPPAPIAMPSEAAPASNGYPV